MASRASAVLALLGLGVAAAAFALTDALTRSWGCSGAGCSAASSAPMTLLAVAAVAGLLVGGVAAGRWLRSTLPRRDGDRRRT